MYIIEIIVYTIFGNTEEQSWNKTKVDEEISNQTLPLKEDFKKWMWLSKTYNLNSFLIQFWLYIVQKIIINNPYSYKEFVHRFNIVVHFCFYMKIFSYFIFTITNDKTYFFITIIHIQY